MPFKDDPRVAVTVSSASNYGTASARAPFPSYGDEGNISDSQPQDDSGAPIERVSPLGRHVNWLSVIFLNVGVMIGTAIFSVPSSLLNETGSVGLTLIYWVIGFLVAAAALSTYLELAAYFPQRAGGEVAYLEQAWPRPRYFFPIAFAVQSVLLSFSSSNTLVVSQYIFKFAGKTPSGWEMKGVAVLVYTVATLLVILNTKWSLWFSNAIGVLKLAGLLFISLIGLAVLGGHTAIQRTSNFEDAFAGTSSNGNSLATALVKVTYAYTGVANAFNLTNEIQNPIPTLKKNSSLALLVVTVLYVLVNIAYFAVVPLAELRASKQVVAALFFERVFGNSAATARGLNVLPILSAFGNLVAVLIGQSRMIRECGRQGVLPFPKFFVSTRPFGTPLGPYLIKWSFTVLMIVAPPAGDAFNFIIDLRSYPESMFIFAMTLGVFVIRRRWQRLGKERPPQFRAWNIALLFYLAANAFLLIMPWVPPKGGSSGGDVSFWYATYCVAGIGIVLLCIVYYVAWIYVLPRWGKYRVRQEVIDFGGGALSNRLVNVPVGQLAAWDETHDETGLIRGVGPRKASADEDAEVSAPTNGMLTADRLASLKSMFNRKSRGTS